jgi:hypothetical protein
MDTAILFEEVQGSENKSVQSFFKITAGLFAIAVVFNLVKQKAVITNLSLLLGAGFLLCLSAAVFSSVKFATQIRTDGIYVRFPPFQPFFTKYTRNNIGDVYLRNYNALTEYNGWGIKTGLAGRGYIVAGDTGIQLGFFNGPRLLQYKTTGWSNGRFKPAQQTSVAAKQIKKQGFKLLSGNN